MKRYRLAIDSTTHKLHLDADPDGQYCDYADMEKRTQFLIELQISYGKLMDQCMALKAQLANIEVAAVQSTPAVIIAARAIIQDLELLCQHVNSEGLHQRLGMLKAALSTARMAAASQ